MDFDGPRKFKVFVRTGCPAQLVRVPLPSSPASGRTFAPNISSGARHGVSASAWTVSSCRAAAAQGKVCTGDDHFDAGAVHAVTPDQQVCPRPEDVVLGSCHLGLLLVNPEDGSR